MAPKTIRKAIADALEDLSKSDYDKFCYYLLSREEEPKVRRNKVEDRGFLVVADLLVRTFTETRALAITLQILREIDCNEVADTLEKDTRANSSKPGSAESSAGGSDGTPSGAEEEHFVDKHQLQLINRVYHVSSLLDELLQKKFIPKEFYKETMALPTSEAQMRKLYLGPLQSTACKDIFYKVLEKDNPYLIEDLKKMK
ncbi:apoptosis-associated speck-like protein containing a CARD isoform X2 [Antennarius striatus]|uniref:apoptosis-associated speck-like protein containing a CARD isoform X2 n=1 Tax=Antennarius striatus TaxID=241820 RepID=UPI0035ADD68A